VVGGDHEVRERPGPIALEDLEHAVVVDVVGVDERKEKARVEEDHSCGAP
jgi:hypothetical protein